MSFSLGDKIINNNSGGSGFSVETIIQAFTSILDPNSSSEIRKSAEKSLQEFKSSPDALSTAFYLVNSKNGFPLNIRLFGLHVLEDNVFEAWNTWSTAIQIEYREAFIKLIAEGLYEFSLEKEAVKEKLAKLVVSVALRMWPQEWEDFWPTVEAMLSSYQIIIVDMGLIILKTLAEDVFIFPSKNIEQKRQNDLKNSLLSQAPLFLKKLTSSMNSFYNQLLAEPSSRDVYERLLGSAVKLWTVYLEWIKLKSLEENNIVELLCLLLVKLNTLSPIILDGLLILVNRYFKTTEQGIFAPLIKNLVFFYTYLNELSMMPQVSESNYYIMKKISNILIDLGLKQICLKKSDFFVDYFSEYLSCLFFLLTHSSHYISFLSLQFWAEVLKHESLYRNPSFESFFTKLISFITAELTLNKNISQAKSSPYFHLDFDSNSEYEQFYATYKNKLFEILRSLSKLRPPEMLSFSCNSLEVFSKYPYDVSTVGNDPLGCTRKSPYYLQLEGNIMLLEVIISGIPPLDTFEKEDSVLLNTVNILYKVLEFLLEFDKKDPLCLNKLLEGLIDTCILLKIYLNNLGLVMNKVMSLIVFSSETLFPLNEEQKEKIYALKRKAASSLVKLSVVFSNELVPFYSSLSNEIKNLLGSPSIGYVEKTSLVEFLLVICQNPKVSEEDKLHCFDFTCSPLINEWNSSFTSEFISSPANFIQYSGISLLLSPEISLADSSEIATRRARLLYLCNGSLVLFKRSLPLNFTEETTSEKLKAAFSTLISIIIPLILQILKTVHLLWDDKTWALEYDEIKNKVTQLSYEEKRVLLDINGSERYENENFNSHEKHLVEIKVWLGNLRITSYSILGTVTLFKNLFYRNNQVVTYLWPSLFFSIQNIQLRHWKNLIQLCVQPLVINCPVEAFQEILEPFIQPFFSYVTERFDNEWKEFYLLSTSSKGYKQRQEQGYEDEDKEEFSEELLQEKLIIASTRALILLIYNAIFPLSERGASSVKFQSWENASPLIKYIFSNKAGVTEPILNTILKCLSWKDTYTCEKALTICQKLVGILGGKAGYINFIGRSLTISVLQILNEGYHQELHDAVISIILLIYQTCFTECENVIASIPTITEKQFQAFKFSFENETDAKKRKTLLRNLLKGITGVKISALFKSENSTIKSLSKSLQEEKTKKELDEDSENHITFGLENIFSPPLL